MDGQTHGGNVRRHTFNDITWVDVHAPGQTVLEGLEKEYGLHPVHLHESVRKVQHNGVERESNYLFLVMHFPLYKAQQDKISVSQLGVFLSKGRLVTIHMEDAPFLDDLYAEFARDTDTQAARSSGYVLFRLIARLLNNLEQLTEAVDVELDEVEDLVFANRSSDAERIGHLREKIVRLRRLTGPKRLLLEDLSQQIGDFAGKDLRRYYDSNLKTVNRLWDEIEESRETVEIYKDADFITSTEQTNQTLAVLTIVFTFTIPVTAIAALYGMNVFLPGGLEAGSWLFLGRYTTLMVILAMSALAAWGMYLYFHKKKWL